MRVGRPINPNPLTKLLLEDEVAKQEFIQLMNQFNCSFDLYEHIKKNGFRGIRFYNGYQTMCHIIRRIGFMGRRGRKPIRKEAIPHTESRYYPIPKR